MSEYAFDAKLWAVVRVKAADEKRAREIAADFLSCLNIGLHADSNNNPALREGEEFRTTEASTEGELDLFEINGKEH